MQYISTRGQAPAVTGAEAILRGLAPDGGLYLPDRLPNVSLPDCLACDTMGIASLLLSAFFPELPDMDALVKRAYVGKFASETLTPTRRVGDFSVLELFRGPTCAFKDVALSMLPQLMQQARHVTGMQKELLILTATSGDTGKAALAGFCNVPGVRICVFYPESGVSDIQRRQMTTQTGRNVAVCAVRGNFDDAQTGVKQIFTAFSHAEAGQNAPFSLSSANSINIGRLIPQITYYFAAYRDLLQSGAITPGTRVNFSVPTGNFGDILAGYLAGRLGLPVGRLICASNANCVLTDFIRTGVYDRNRPLKKTCSPSMDILVSSNLERLLYLLGGEDPAQIAAYMDALAKTGEYTVSAPLHAAIRAQFWAACCDDAQTRDTIGRVWQAHGYLCDPHTAAAWYAAERYRAETGDSGPTVVLATASPYKFPAAVLSALGEAPTGDAFAQIARLSARTQTPIPDSLAALAGMPEIHTDVIEKASMPEYVRALGRTQADRSKR